MKKIYIKYKILVNGLNIIGKYNIDGFSLKTSNLEKEVFDIKQEEQEQGVSLNMNLYLTSCLTNYDTLSYNYFESENYEEYEVSNKTQVSKHTIGKILKSKKEIIDKVNNLEKKLRIVLNIPILFQSINAQFYDESKKYIGTVQCNRPISFWNRLTYDMDPKEFSNNCRFNLNFKNMISTGNNNFNRALEFYNDSFESEKISNRYILIFSCLEAIFNLDGENIREKISRFSAKLLAEYNEKMYNKIYSDVTKLYKKRCDYIHGSKKNNIFIEDEKLLRNYVRKIIIAYWTIIITTKKTAKQILDYLGSEEKLDIQIRMIITSLNSENFSSQQHRIIELLENSYNIDIPEETKASILSKC